MVYGIQLQTGSNKQQDHMMYYDNWFCLKRVVNLIDIIWINLDWYQYD